MASIMRMPKLGLTMEKGTIVMWYKKEGDKIVKGETILEIETDKIVNEIESPYSGILLKILSPQDTEIAIQSPICIIGKPDENIEESLKKILKEKFAKTTTSKKEAILTDSSLEQVTDKRKVKIIITPRAKKLMKEKGLSPSIVQEIRKTRIAEKDIMNHLQNKARKDHGNVV